MPTTATINTSKGLIKIELDMENTPITCENFLSYARKGFYDGTIFHRVIQGFMIQGGGLTAELENKKTDPTITNEAKTGGKNKVGTVAMARTSDPHSASSQFFINVADNDFLDFTSDTKAGGWGYCVFGKVIEGMNVVHDIEKVKTGSRAGYQDVPVEDVVIESVVID